MATPAGIVVVAHGGQDASKRSVTALDPPVLRMIPIAWAIRRAVGSSGITVLRVQFQLRGWNGEQASPAADLNRLLDHIAAEHDGVPVLLVGHSMGGRAAFRTAGHPAVRAVAGLAPWLPFTEPVRQLAGRRVLVVHGNRDGIVKPSDTWAYAERARTVASVTSVTAIEIAGGDHAMLRRAPLWHALTAEFARLCFGLPAGPDPAAAAVRAAAPGITRL